VVAGKHEFARKVGALVFHILKPKKVDQMVRADVEDFLTSLNGQGKLD
jgi:hypothetical protein